MTVAGSGAVEPVTGLLGRRRGSGPAIAAVVLWATAASMLPQGLPSGIVLVGAVVGCLYSEVGVGIVVVDEHQRGKLDPARSRLRPARVPRDRANPPGGVEVASASDFVMVGQADSEASTATPT